MALVYVVVAILGASFGARAIVRPYVDGDLFWQKHLGAYVLANHALPSALGGETFSAPGAPWIPQEWLFSTLVAYLLDRNGLWVLALGAAAALSIAALVTVVRGRRIGASPLALCLCTALLAVDLDGSYGIRAQVYAWPFFAALLFVLDGEGAWCFLALPLVALWANLHASAAIAVPMIWIDAIVRLLQRGIRERGVRLRLALSAAAPFALLATPLGAKLPLYALALVRSPIRRFIDEWQPLRWDHHFFWYGALPMLVLVALCARTLARERPRDLVWVALLTAMSVEAVRNAALLGFVVLPLAARALDLLLDRFALWHVDPLRSAGPR
ncbi:MAG TPA: hypothetical protein VMH02_04205, partial [Verrucomicrobiae bacterium]|nr:hypothetical protein [Verrucomicrobiae bacterium]